MRDTMQSLSAKANAYYQLTKPGIIRLLVLTTSCTMIVAAKGLPDPWLYLWTMLGTAMVCSSANTLNMVWDQDIDQIMNRTAHRPLVTGQLNSRQALTFAALLGFGGVLILTFKANPLAALMGIAGHAFYVLIYTMWLKRRTPQNIVIGGAAGAFPPLIGWAAVTGSLSLTAWLIFMVIFLWTPPHFWALALYKDVEYGKANIPMMPVVRGHHTTKLQMLIYMFLLLGCTTFLAVAGTMGIIYLVSSIILGVIFAYYCLRTAYDRTNSDTWPRKTFLFSLLYLALIFAAMSIDSVQTKHFSRYTYLTSIEQEAQRLRAQQSVDELRALHNARAIDAVVK